VVRFLTNLTLWKKITLLTALGLLLGTWVFSSLGMRAVNQATEAMLQDRLTTAGLVADYIDEALQHAVSELETTAQMVASNPSLANVEASTDQIEATYARLSIYVHSVYLVDGGGQVLWSKPAIPTNGGSGIYQALQGTGSRISGLTSAPVTNTPVVLLAAPIGQPASSGTLVVAIDLAKSSIGGFVQPIRLGKTGYVEVVDQNGTVVARTEPGPKLAPFEKSDHSGRFAALISAGQPTRGVCHTCHDPGQKVEKRDVLAFMPLSQAGWGVVIRQSEDEALAPSYRLRQSLILFGVGLIIVALFFVLITTRDIGSRIRILTAVSRRIAQGNLVSPVAALGKDEVGTLARTLDDMRIKLRTSYAELEQKTKELSSLLSVSEILTSTFDLPKLLDAVVHKAIEVISGVDPPCCFYWTLSRGESYCSALLA
jgi:methyl-accepting chemotaxis protein